MFFLQNANPEVSHFASFVYQEAKRAMFGIKKWVECLHFASVTLLFCVFLCIVYLILLQIDMFRKCLCFQFELHMKVHPSACNCVSLVIDKQRNWIQYYVYGNVILQSKYSRQLLDYCYWPWLNLHSCKSLSLLLRLSILPPNILEQHFNRLVQNSKYDLNRNVNTFQSKLKLVSRKMLLSA